MTKASMNSQDLRRRIYVKAKAETILAFLGIVRPCLQDGDATRGVCAGQTERWGSGSRWGHLRGHQNARRRWLSSNRLGRTQYSAHYVPLPARKQEIPKDGGKVRVLSIPAIRDRVVQGALKLILEPIFEADFQPGSFGYRPKRTAHDAVDRVARAIVQQKTRIINIDLRSYFRQCPTRSAVGEGGNVRWTMWTCCTC